MQGVISNRMIHHIIIAVIYTSSIRCFQQGDEDFCCEGEYFCFYGVGESAKTKRSSVHQGERENGYFAHIYWGCSRFLPSNCQRWDFYTPAIILQ